MPPGFSMAANFMEMKMATQKQLDELREIVFDYIKTEVGTLDTCTANVQIIASRIQDPSAQGLKMEQQIRAAIQQGGLIENQEIKNLIDVWLKRNSDYDDNFANRGLLRLAFVRQNGTPINIARTLETLNTHAQFLVNNNQLARSAASLKAEAETQRSVAAASREVQEQVRMIQELLAPWAAKVSKNPYVSGSGEITQRQYDQKENDLYALSLDDLRARHTDIMAKRELRNLDPQALKLRIRAQQQQFQPGNQHLERYLPLPKQLVFSPEIHPRQIDAALLRWMANNDMPRYKNFLEKYGAQQISDRIDGRDTGE